MRPHLLRVVCVVLGTAFPSAQEPAFEVASIRPTQSTQPGEIQTMPNGRFLATHSTPKALILRSYGLVDAQVIGAPSWLDAERFDIDARAGTAPPEGPESLPPLVRALLVERLKLTTHPDVRELSAYALTFARRDRRLGPQVRETQAAGRFDVEYSFAPHPQAAGVESVFGPEAPTLPVAVEEQLGLKLESRRMPVPVLVIDSIERPSEN
jgi:hypothetical protein